MNYELDMHASLLFTLSSTRKLIIIVTVNHQICFHIPIHQKINTLKDMQISDIPCAKIKRTKYMRNINDNAVQGRLSENYLTRKIIA